MRATSMMWSILGIENACVELRKLACEGSFLTSQQKADSNKNEIKERLIEIQSHISDALSAFNKN